MITKSQLWAKVRGSSRMPPRSPAPSAIPLPCVHEGAILEYCKTCRSGEGRHVRDCDLHDRCTRTFVSAAVRSCDRCADYQIDGSAVDTFTFHLDAMGIGDSVCGYYAACGLADATGKPVRYHACHHVDWLSAVSHPLVTVLPKAAVGFNANGDYAGQLRGLADRSCQSRTQWMCDNIAHHFGLPKFTPSRPPVVSKPPAPLPGQYVVLSPFSTHHVREWPAEKWCELAVRLTARGHRVIGIDGSGVPDKYTPFAGAPIEWHRATHPKVAVAIIANADRLYGNDSGMAHVAGLMNTPTVAIMTHVFAEQTFSEATTVVDAPLERWACQGCAWQASGGFHAGCQTKCQALHAIDVSTVLEAASPPATVDAVIETVRRKSNIRAGTTEWVMRRLLASGGQMVETGCVRSRWDWGAGYATWLYGRLLDAADLGHLTSVDLNPRHCGTARLVCRDVRRLTVLCEDSVSYLMGRTAAVDVAYLDSLDTDQPGHAEHCLREAEAVSRLIGPGGLILIDDSPPDGDGWSGKGRLAIPWLIARGWVLEPVSSHQAVLSRPA